MFAEHLLWANYCFRYQRYNGIQQTDIPAITQPPVYWADIDNKPTRKYLSVASALLFACSSLSAPVLVLLLLSTARHEGMTQDEPIIVPWTQ